MNDTPGWASPGSSPSDEPDRSAPEQPEQPAPPDGAPSPGKWSDRQPPPGRWAAPATSPPARPGPGGGGPPGGGGDGWGSGWAQAPPAARPGIIPLRPLGVGEILDGAVSAMRAYWRTVLGISLAVALVTQTAVTVAQGVWFTDTSGLEALQNEPAPTLSETLDAAGSTLASTGATWLVVMLGTIVATAMLTMIVSRAVLGQPVSAGEAWRDSRPRLPHLFGLLFLIPLIVAGVAALALAPGLLLVAGGATRPGAALVFLGALAALVGAVWVWIRYSLAAPALMLEKQGVTDALRRSAKLVRGAWWRVFGIQVLTLVLVLFVSAVVEIPTTIAGMVLSGESPLEGVTGETAGTGWTFLIVSGIGAVLSSTLTFPISAGVTALLYIDQRIRREALDLELARAADVPGYAVPGPDGPKPHDGSQES